jgi:hypothetical protein
MQAEALRVHSLYPHDAIDSEDKGSYERLGMLTTQLGNVGRLLTYGSDDETRTRLEIELVRLTALCALWANKTVTPETTNSPDRSPI